MKTQVKNQLKEQLDALLDVVPTEEHEHVHRLRRTFGEIRREFAELKRESDNAHSTAASTKARLCEVSSEVSNTTMALTEHKKTIDTLSTKLDKMSRSLSLLQMATLRIHRLMFNSSVDQHCPPMHAFDMSDTVDALMGQDHDFGLSFSLNVIHSLVRWASTEERLPLMLLFPELNVVVGVGLQTHDERPDVFVMTTEEFERSWRQCFGSECKMTLDSSFGYLQVVPPIDQ